MTKTVRTSKIVKYCDSCRRNSKKTRAVHSLSIGSRQLDMCRICISDLVGLLTATMRPEDRARIAAHYGG